MMFDVNICLPHIHIHWLRILLLTLICLIQPIIVDSNTCKTAARLAGVTAASASTSTEGSGRITWPCKHKKIILNDFVWLLSSCAHLQLYCIHSWALAFPKHESISVIYNTHHIIATSCVIFSTSLLSQIYMYLHFKQNIKFTFDLQWFSNVITSNDFTLT